MSNTETEILKTPDIHASPGSGKPTRQIEWNDKIELTTKDIGDKCKTYKLLHLTAAQRTSKIYEILMYLGLCLGPLSGILTTINAIYPEYKNLFTILSIGFNFLCGIAVAIVKFGKYDIVSSSHKTIASRYTSLESNVRRQLDLYRIDRESALEYLKWLSNSFDDIFNNAPLLPEALLYEKNEVESKYITINRDYENKKLAELKDDTSIRIVRDEDKKLARQETVKRPIVLSPLPDIERYNDKMMQYELKRFINQN